MQRRQFLQTLAAAGALGSLPYPAAATVTPAASAPSVTTLPALDGKLTLYLGRGEGGLYENVLQAIEDRNPGLELGIRRGPTAALANAIVAEAQAGIRRADLFWAVDSGAIGLVSNAGLARTLPSDLAGQLKPGFRFDHWLPVTGRVRTIPYHSGRLSAADIPKDIMSLPARGFRIGWAPAYASFQSFITAMRILEGEDATVDWLQRVSRNAKTYAGELGVVLAVARGEVDIGFANHYYTLRLKSGKPDAQVALAFTEGDAGCLVNASGILALGDDTSRDELPVNFIRYLFTREVQSFLAEEAYEIPLVNGVALPAGLPSLDSISPPAIDLTRLADQRPTLDLMRKAGVL